MTLEYVSATQVERAEQCMRRWAEAYIFENREPKSPAMERGSQVHKEIEVYLKSGLLGSTEYSPLIVPIVDLVPKPSPGMLIERKIEMATYEGGPMWLGYLDLGYCLKSGLLCVDDFKTRGNFRNNKKPEALLIDIQLTSYAKFLLEMGPIFYPGCDVTQVKIGHINIDAASPRAVRIETLITRAQIDERFNKSLDTVRKMVEVARSIPVNSKMVAYNADSCDVYGGCFYASSCGFDVALEHLFRKQGRKTSQEGIMTTQKLTLQERVALVKKAQESGEPTASLLIAEGILPPDAPSRDEIIVAPEPLPERAKKPKKTDKVKIESISEARAALEAVLNFMKNAA